MSRKPFDVLITGRLILGALFGMCWAQLILGFMLKHNGQTKLDENSFPQMILATVGMHGSILLAVGGWLKFKRISWSEAFGFGQSPAIRSIIPGVLAAALFLPVGMLMQSGVVTVLKHFHIETPPQLAVQTLHNIQSLGLQIYMTVFAVLLAPLAEEVAFRGVIYPALKQSRYPRAALWITSILFGAIHCNLASFIPLTVLAMVLALPYENTDNLLAPITAHSVFNIFNVILLFAHDSFKDQPLAQ